MFMGFRLAKTCLFAKLRIGLKPDRHSITVAPDRTCGALNPTLRNMAVVETFKGKLKFRFELVVILAGEIGIEVVLGDGALLVIRSD
jgi:hypothetical protein